jgi:hypothetical protein
MVYSNPKSFLSNWANIIRYYTTKVHRSQQHQKLSKTLLPLCPLRPLRFNHIRTLDHFYR